MARWFGWQTRRNINVMFVRLCNGGKIYIFIPAVSKTYQFFIYSLRLGKRFVLTRNYFKQKLCFASGMVRAEEKIKYSRVVHLVCHIDLASSIETLDERALINQCRESLKSNY